jgi:hypothetical protein
MVTRVMVHPDVGRQGDLAGGFGGETVLLGCLDVRARLRRWAGCSAMARWSRPTPCLLWEDRYLTGPPRRDLGHCGNAIIRIACAASGAVLIPAGQVGMIMAGFVPIFGVQAFEKPVGTAGFEPATP